MNKELKLAIESVLINEKKSLPLNGAKFQYLRHQYFRQISQICSSEPTIQLFFTIKITIEIPFDVTQYPSYL